MPPSGGLLILSGPSGVGKTTVWRELARLDPRYRRSVSCTTRPPRPGEKDGVDYHFLTPAQFSAKVAAGEFAEWNAYGVNRYGTLQAAIKEGLARGHWLVFIIEVKGSADLRRAYPNALSFFLLPPSHEELVRRLAGRRDVGEAEMKQRLAIAQEELAAARDYAYHVTNDDPLASAQRIHEIVIAKWAEAGS
jgi:guanylate kinase